MKEAFRTSPFDGRNGQDIREKWIVWQRHDAEERVEKTKQTDSRYVQTESRLAEPAPTMQPTFQHQRYDAVMKRMQHAARQTGSYTSVS